MFYIFDMKNFDSTEFGKRLGILMTETNMTQSMLAAKIDVSQRAVSKWLNGKSEPSAGALFRLALYFETSADLRIFFSDFRTTETPTLFCPRVCRGAGFFDARKNKQSSFVKHESHFYGIVVGKLEACVYVLHLFDRHIVRHDKSVYHQSIIYALCVRHFAAPARGRVQRRGE